VSIGCSGRPFATADPGLDDLLPADDALWDQGVTLNTRSSFPVANQLYRLLDQMIRQLYLHP
jgi:hypothetical protein